MNRRVSEGISEVVAFMLKSKGSEASHTEAEKRHGKELGAPAGQQGDQCGWRVLSEGRGMLDKTRAGWGGVGWAEGWSRTEVLEGVELELVLARQVRFESENRKHFQSKVSCEDFEWYDV